MGSSHGFGSTPRDRDALFRLAFAMAPAGPALTRPRRVTRRVILQKARRHSHKDCSDCMSADDFRVSFTPLAGVLFTVPSRYCALSVIWGMEPWEVVSPASDPVLRAGPYLRLFPGVQSRALRGCHPLWRRVPNVFVSQTIQAPCCGPPTTGKACNPVTARRWCLARSRFRRAPVRSPLLRG